MKSLTGSVGRGGKNHKKEVVRVQAVLNVLPTSVGGPAVPLRLDDIVGPKTIAAIEGFQTFQFGKADGRVDVDGPTVLRLAMLEESALNLPLTLLEPNRKLAIQWVQAGLTALHQAVDGNGEPMPEEQVPRRTRDMFAMFFSLQWSGTARDDGFRKQVDGESLAFIQDKLATMLQCLTNDGLYVPSQVMEMYHDLRENSQRTMCGGSMVGPIVNYAFCDPDAVNGCGAPLEVRAACLIQGAAFAADPKDFREVGVMQPDFFFSGMVMAADAPHFSPCLLFACQYMAQAPKFYFWRNNGAGFTPDSRPMMR